MKKLLKLIKAIFIAMGGWWIYFFSGFFPRSEMKIVFGVHTNSLSGNVKALYLDSNYQKNKTKVFIYKNKKVRSYLKELNGDYIYYSVFSIKGIWHILTAKKFIYSSYPSDISFWLSRGAELFNVWHGTPLKKIERDVNTGFYAIKNRYERILKFIFPYLYAKPNLLLVSSDYEKKCFTTAFSVSGSQLVLAFPPRLIESRKDYINSINKDSILYCPTWRDDNSFSFYKNCNLSDLNELMIKENKLFIIKAHPSDSSVHLDKKYSNIKLADRTDDFYQLVKRASLVITDYSSIMFDCLYCNIPVALFCPDIQNYLKNSREFYCEMNQLPFAVYKNLIDLVASKEHKLNSDKIHYFSPYTNFL
ncbi:CDP-glycerol glycerophosphotransferase family protein [Frederiksenia canicola]|uniref:CDP-glycerol glycerophosphotransferase n=1 Tax=Frederiksenia canicola TaxID=123824 RepID=A0AAE6X4I7_9PAST|nr:CDP-glycerol glycerophosphotransferase family protein [Frederiksenia canicola]QIM64077.1 CDP-glycerol glycerophosphotransferase [Frederiksenia canicola]RPE93607.1 CDP-glycerol glycerophosphotransferase (TagB/SpsB family) [Frederiksenia canicola]